ncbi:MAG TPA: hypothetical protein DCM36_02935 [Xanthomonadaceae bacterium]|nr:hypothetical protein [Xanthomonadaceae bacterium]
MGCQMLFDSEKRGAALEAAFEAVLRGGEGKWPVGDTQARVLRRYAERLKVVETAKAEAEQALASMRAERDGIQVRFELITSCTADGLWDMNVVAGDPLNPNNEIWWSPQFRRLLGFETEAEFPNRLESLTERLHPEDGPAQLAQLVAHINDRSGNTPTTCVIASRCAAANTAGSMLWERPAGPPMARRFGWPVRWRTLPSSSTASATWISR